MTLDPQPKDSDNNLLFKWCQSMSNSLAGIHAPKIGDSDNVLLRKLLNLFRAS
jgi:hypothetical protein